MKFQKWVKSFDKYGESVDFNYRGKQKLQTFPGALVTLVFSFILFLYTVAKFRQMVTGDNASTSFMTNIKQLE
jgi:hypothetical protein